MNWIKSNPFVSGLAGITILLCGILFFLASKWSTKYEEAQMGFEGAFQSVTTSESLPLYPTAENRDGKSKALVEHRAAIEELGKLFDAYRPEKTEDISPQVFTDRLKAATDEVTKAFGDESELPENFFLGFDAYRNQLAQSNATGTLLHQLDGIKAAMLGLAKSRPTALLKVYRQPVEEEAGNTYQPAPDDIARYFSFEVTFKGSEASAREFISSLGATESHYFIIRTLKIQNERETPPKVSDAKFEVTAAAQAPVAPANPFGDAFFAPDPDPAPVEEESDENAPAPDGAAPNAAAPEATPAPPAAEVDSSRILAQVLGSEELIVFIRFDIAMFLPAKELPKP